MKNIKQRNIKEKLRDGINSVAFNEIHIKEFSIDNVDMKIFQKER